MVVLPKSTLIARWAVINALLLSLVFVAFFNGMLDDFLVDNTFITQGILAAFAMMLVYTGYCCVRIQADWNTVEQRNLDYRVAEKAGNGNDFRDVVLEEYSRRLAWHKMSGSLLAGFGLLGTVIGIRMGFAGVDSSAVGDAQQASVVLVALLSGLATALNTTAAGMVGMLWNMLNLHLMSQEFSKLFSAIVQD